MNNSEFNPNASDNSGVVSVDADALVSEFSKVKFETSTEASTYAREKETISYINSIFQARDMVKAFWNSCVSQANSYSINAQDIDLPETFIDDSGDLDEADGNDEMPIAVDEPR